MKELIRLFPNKVPNYAPSIPLQKVFADAAAPSLRFLIQDAVLDTGDRMESKPRRFVLASVGGTVCFPIHFISFPLTSV